MRRSFGWGVPVALAVAVALAACGSSSSSTSSSTSSAGPAKPAAAVNAPIKIFSIADTTGPTKIYGAGRLSGLEGAADYLNAMGGVDGHKIVITHVSDGGDPTQSVTALIKYLSSNPAPTLVDAGAEGNVAQALVPILAKKKVLAMSLNDGSGVCGQQAETRCPHQFALQAPAAVQQQTAADWFKQHGIKKVGVLLEDIAFTQSEVAPFEKALSKEGIQHTDVGFPATATSLTSEVSQLKGSGAQALYVLALGPAAGYALKARSQLAWNVPVVFDPAASSLDITTLAPPSETKNSYVDIYQVANPSAKMPGRALMLKWSTPHGLQSAVPLDVPGLGWDEMLLLANAVKQAHSLNYQTLTNTILNLAPAGRADPLYVTARQIGYTTSNHENVLGRPSDYVIAPVGPISEGQVK
jgi:branched-chain amino acid transport system substrate-binding protein